MIRAYWWNNCRNFGDILNPMLIEGLSKDEVVYSDTDFDYICCGSVIEHPNRQGGYSVWGSGTLSDGLQITGHPDKIHCVRGPLTRQKYLNAGIDCPEIYGDPALLLPFVYNKPVSKKYDIGIIPHYYEYESRPNELNDALTNIKQDHRICVINIAGPVTDIIDRVRECKIVLSSTLHGLICADAYGVPAILCSFSRMVEHIIDLKYEDYYRSVNRKWRTNYDICRGTDYETIMRDFYNIVETPTIDLQPIIWSCPFIPKTRWL